jgi:hypothetical protein
MDEDLESFLHYHHSRDVPFMVAKTSVSKFLISVASNVDLDFFLMLAKLFSSCCWQNAISVLLMYAYWLTSFLYQSRADKCRFLYLLFFNLMYCLIACLVAMFIDIVKIHKFEWNMYTLVMFKDHQPVCYV